MGVDDLEPGEERDDDSPPEPMSGEIRQGADPALEQVRPIEIVVFIWRKNCK